MQEFDDVYNEDVVARWVELSDQSFKVDENTRIASRPRKWNKRRGQCEGRHLVCWNTSRSAYNRELIFEQACTMSGGGIRERILFGGIEISTDNYTACARTILYNENCPLPLLLSYYQERTSKETSSSLGKEVNNKVSILHPKLQMPPLTEARRRLYTQRCIYRAKDLLEHTRIVDDFEIW